VGFARFGGGEREMYCGDSPEGAKAGSSLHDRGGRTGSFIPYSNKGKRNSQSVVGPPWRLSRKREKTSWREGGGGRLFRGRKESNSEAALPKRGDRRAGRGGGLLRKKGGRCLVSPEKRGKPSPY